MVRVPLIARSCIIFQVWLKGGDLVISALHLDTSALKQQCQAQVPQAVAHFLWIPLESDFFFFFFCYVLNMSFIKARHTSSLGNFLSTC